MFLHKTMVEFKFPFVYGLCRTWKAFQIGDSDSSMEVVNGIERQWKYLKSSECSCQYILARKHLKSQMFMMVLCLVQRTLVVLKDSESIR
jgi:hypothetical protein